jgi:hypothetical protein
MVANSVLGAACASFDLPQKHGNLLNPDQLCGGNASARTAPGRPPAERQMMCRLNAQYENNICPK